MQARVAGYLVARFGSEEEAWAEQDFAVYG